MTLKDFSKNLSREIENLAERLGSDQLPDDAGRLDTSIDIADLLEQVKNLDHDAPKG